MTAIAWSVAYRAVAPLDRARAVVLRALAPVARPLFGSRDARVAIYAGGAILSAFALTLLAPVWLLVIGPLALGIPHLVADARYVVVRPGLHRRAGLVCAVGAPLALTWIWPSAACALLGVVGAGLAARGRWTRRAVVIGLGVAAVVASATTGRPADLVLAHGHHAVALTWWWLLARRSPRHVAPLALIAACLAALWLLPLPAAASEILADARVAGMIQGLSPTSAGDAPLRWGLTFAFLQAVHYAVWLRLVPEEARERAGVRSFGASLRALGRDLGGWPLAIAALAALAVAAYGLVDPEAARTTYLRAAYGHGFVELAALALVFIEGTALVRGPRGGRR